MYMIRGHIGRRSHSRRICSVKRHRLYSGRGDRKAWNRYISSDSPNRKASMMPAGSAPLSISADRERIGQ